MKRTVLPILLVIVLQWPMFAQVAVGQWREHLPYKAGINVAYTGDIVYCATQSGLYSYDQTDMTIQRMSKVNGLSDVGFSGIAFHEATNTVVIAYSNTNIDLLQDNTIINLPDIKNKPILGLKVINNIHIEGDFAYLACGFGIVVIDLLKHEIKDTYFIGEQGAQINVQDIDINAQSILAATAEGIFVANRNSPFLANFEEWERDTTLPIASYNTIAALGNKIMVNRRVEEHDTLYWKEAAEWNYFDTTAFALVRSLDATNGAFTISSDRELDAFDEDFINLWHAGNYPNLDLGCKPSQIFQDPNGELWIADLDNGLIKVGEGYICERFAINGPVSIGAADIDVWNSQLYVVGGSISSSWGNTFNLDGLSRFQDESWSVHNTFSLPDMGLAYDFVKVKVNPFDSKRVYATTWGTGLVELYDGEVVARYDTTNSGLQSIPGSEGIRLFGLQTDNDGNLWIGASESNDLLFCKTPENEWYSYYLGSLVPSAGNLIRDIAIDDIGQKWLVMPRGIGVIVYNDGGTLANTSDDQQKKLTQSLGNGNLASNDISCIAKDLDGEIWVGTNNGISVFYTPEAVFEGGDFDSQQILIEQDGYVQHLLENENVTDIEVDGANRKWIATSSAGVFLMSEDGTEEVLHFTTENSPLFSDAINSLAIDQLTGEVFIGTEKGVLSYRSDATYGGNTFEDYDVYAFPNPVEPNYDGPIAIKGLVTNADVKIADASGRVVFATTAEGGTAIWNGRNPDGKKAQSGVYLVFASNDDGSEAMVTKILLIN